MKGLRDIRTFVTADALLAAVLLVWAQTWAQPSLQLWSRYYQLECGNMPDAFQSFNNSAGAGLVFTYIAVFLALLALVLAGWRSFENRKKDTPTDPSALGLFSAALLFAIFDVLQSIASVGVKLLQHEWIYGTYAPSDLPTWFIWVGGPIVILLILIPVYAFSWKYKKEGWSLLTGCWERILGCRWLSWLSWKCCWKIEIVLAILLAGLWLYSGWEGLGQPSNIIIASALGLLLIFIIRKELCALLEKLDCNTGGK